MKLLDEVNRISLSKTGRLPDLENPRGYNDKLHWLKLFDQRSEHVTCCDKWAVRDYVERRVGRDVLIGATTVYPPRKYPCVAKCTHDSGSAGVLMNAEDMQRHDRKLQTRLGQTYGKGLGEWAYRLIEPQIIVEDFLADKSTDYKFHCVDGKVRWVQVIWDRGPGSTKEAVLMPDGTVTKLHMDEKMTHIATPWAYPGDRAWNDLTRLAERLSRGWRYVRVDLYWEWGNPWFGEMTFWPRAGCYRSTDEPVFGDMLDIDTSYKLEPLVM